MHNPSPTSESRGVLLMLASVLLFAVNVLLIRGLALQVPGIDGWMATLWPGFTPLELTAAALTIGATVQILRPPKPTPALTPPPPTLNLAPSSTLNLSDLNTPPFASTSVHHDRHSRRSATAGSRFLSPQQLITNNG